MKGKLALAFTSGAIFGSLVTYIIIKRKESSYEVIETEGKQDIISVPIDSLNNPQAVEKEQDLEKNETKKIRR